MSSGPEFYRLTCRFTGIIRDPSPLDVDNFLARVRDTILSDTQAPPSERFDTLKIGPAESDALQNQVFNALVGISPKNLEIFDGLTKYFNLRSLSKVEDSWTEFERIGSHKHLRGQRW